MLGQAVTRRRQADPSALGLDQPRPGFFGERGDLLRHGRCREVVRLGDRPHRAQPRHGRNAGPQHRRPLRPARFDALQQHREFAKHRRQARQNHLEHGLVGRLLRAIQQIVH